VEEGWEGPAGIGFTQPLSSSFSILLEEQRPGGGESCTAVGGVEQLRHISSYSDFELMNIKHQLPAF